VVSSNAIMFMPNFMNIGRLAEYSKSSKEGKRKPTCSQTQYNIYHKRVSSNKESVLRTQEFVHVCPYNFNRVPFTRAGF
jgi:hypothetical protein